MASSRPPISSDLHIGNVNGPVYDLVTTLSKFLLLGLSVEDVIAMATARPAAAIGRSGELGSIAVGGVADLSLLRLVEGRFTFRDALRDERVGDRRLEPVATIRAGVVSDPSPWRGGPSDALSAVYVERDDRKRNRNTIAVYR